MYKLGEDDTSRAPIDVALFYRLDLAAMLIAWCCLWSIKLSFLLLYRRIFKVSLWFTRAWWAVAAFVGLTFWALVAGTVTQCGRIGRIESAEEYCTSPAMIQRQKVFVIYSCVLNVLTDVAIMALPLAMTPTLQIPPKAKLSLAAIFGLASFIIIFDILRTAETLRRSHIVGSVALWTDLEAAIAIIVSCLPSFVALFRSRKGDGAEKTSGRYRSRPLVVSAEAKQFVEEVKHADDDGQVYDSERSSPVTNTSLEVLASSSKEVESGIV
ncbi:MAG: hypothetical protein Q9195_005740 [Heterodermia aff. obscurata]